MIRYALLCPLNHGFEAWFRDSDTFDRQSEAGQVMCPSCGAHKVRKAVMAPAVRRSTEKRGRAAPIDEAQTVEPKVSAQQISTAPSPIVDEHFDRMRAVLREVHAKLKRDAVDVGPAFPDQARRIHDGDAPPRAIYGTATDDEVRALVEEGIGIMPIPALPEDRN